MKQNEKYLSLLWIIQCWPLVNGTMLFFFRIINVIRQASQGLELHAKECSVDVYNDKNRLVGTHKPIEEFTIAFLSLNRVVIFLSPRDFCSPCLSIPLLPSQFKHPIKTPKRTNLRQHLTNHSVQQFFKIWVAFKTILVFDIFWFELNLAVHLRTGQPSVRWMN